MHLVIGPFALIVILIIIFAKNSEGDPIGEFLGGIFGAGIGPKLGGLVGFTKGGARGITLTDLQCDGRQTIKC